MKRKGFTLVELLAVIVILALIALITVPIIIGVVDKSRRGALQNSGYGLVEAGTLYNAQYQNGKTIRFDIEDNEVTSEEKNKLIYKGNVKEGTVLINNKGKVVICINDGKYAAYKNFSDNKVTIVDNKTCTVPENSNVVYLDNEPTINKSNEELLTDIEYLKKEIENLKLEKANQNDVNNLIHELETKNASLSSEIATLKQNSTTLNKVYPVGSIYISTNDVNPASLFGGTWEKYASGRTLVGEGTGNDNLHSVSFTLNQIGGEYYHKLTVAEIPSHNHSMVFNGENIYFAYGDQNAAPWSGRGVSSTEGRTTGDTGGGQYHNNIQPYIVVSIWKRVS